VQYLRITFFGYFFTLARYLERLKLNWVLQSHSNSSSSWSSANSPLIDFDSRRSPWVLVSGNQTAVTFPLINCCCRTYSWFFCQTNKEKQIKHKNWEIDFKIMNLCISPSLGLLSPFCCYLLPIFESKLLDIFSDCIEFLLLLRRGYPSFFNKDLKFGCFSEYISCTLFETLPSFQSLDNNICLFLCSWHFSK